MKKLILILILCFPCVSYCQIDESINLSYNLTIDSINVKKIRDKNNIIHFYINSEHFQTLTSPKIAQESNFLKLPKIKILDIYEFTALANEKRLQLIQKDKKEQTIKILFNDEVFDRIYLYEVTSNNSFIKYRVKWVEEIQ